MTHRCAVDEANRRHNHYSSYEWQSHHEEGQKRLSDLQQNAQTQLVSSTGRARNDRRPEAGARLEQRNKVRGVLVSDAEADPDPEAGHPQTRCRLSRLCPDIRIHDIGGLHKVAELVRSVALLRSSSRCSAS